MSLKGLEPYAREDLVAAIRKGDVALWLGPVQTEQQTGSVLAGVNWLGIWSSGPSDSLFEELGRSWPGKKRQLAKIPGRIEDVLDPNFWYSAFCPLFILDAGDNARGTLTERQQRIARDKKIDQLDRLSSAILLLAACENPELTSAVISDEILDAAPNLRRLIVCDPRGTAFEKETTDLLSKSIGKKVQFAYGTLNEVLREILEEAKESAPGQEILVGDTMISIEDLTKSEPPVDEFFDLILREDIAPPRDDELTAQLILDLLRADMTAWRAFAHDLEWKRDLIYESIVLTELRTLESRHDSISCLTIPAEAGSGVTTLLQRIAYSCAQRGYPALIHRAESGSLNYQTLRKFLTDLLRGAPREVPVVLVFDVASTEFDLTSQIVELPQRLALDGRSAVVLRAVPLQRGKKSSSTQAKLYFGRHADVRAQWLPSLSSELTATEQESLVDWASSRGFQPSQITRIESWYLEDQDAPLLVCLYFVLAENLRDSVGLGQHLVSRFLAALPETEASPSSESAGDSATLTGDDLRRAIERLKIGLSERFQEPDPSPGEICRSFLCLSYLSILRQWIPRSVLVDAARIRPTVVDRVLRFLDDLGLLEGLRSETIDTSSSKNRRLAPAAFYNTEESFGLRHPDFGRLIVSWLNSQQSSAFLGTFSTLVADDELLAGIEKPLDIFPINLAEPIIRRVGQLPRHKAFLEEFSARYLRIQTNPLDPLLSSWKKRNSHLLLEAFSWISSRTMSSSSVLQHSRGITAYKAAANIPDISEARQLYVKAEEYLVFAAKLASSEAKQGEKPEIVHTSLGHLYLQWLASEGLNEAQDSELISSLKMRLESSFRKSLGLRSSNSYASYGLARYLLDEYRQYSESTDKSGTARASLQLCEAIELLQNEPEAHFVDMWERLKADAFQLLDSNTAKLLIKELTAKNSEIGFALDALRMLGGHIPTDLLVPKSRIGATEAAYALLQSSPAIAAESKSSLAEYLRYILFSSLVNMPDGDPEFSKRFELLSRLEGSSYLDAPILMFDTAMLAFQTGDYALSSQTFLRLRKGQRFFEVPLERSVLASQHPNTRKPLVARFRVVVLEERGKGWGRIEGPFVYPTRIPFSIRAFRRHGVRAEPGGVTTVHVELQPAGPLAVPAR